MILAIGEVLIDMVTHNEVATLANATNTTVKVGGSPANFSLFCKKLGGNVMFVACAGADGLGDMIITHLEAAGLVTDFISRHPYQPTSLIVVGRSKQTPEFIPYRGADVYLELPPQKLIDAAEIIHTTAFALSREPASTTILQTCSTAFAAGKKIAIDWNYAEKIWGQKNTAEGVFEQLLNYKPLLKVSLDDAERFWGTTTIDAAKAKLTGLNCLVICLTCGADGVWYKQDKAGWIFKPSLPANVIDVTGAGDAFWAGFICSYLNNAGVDESVDHALSIAKQRVQQEI